MMPRPGSWFRRFCAVAFMRFDGCCLDFLWLAMFLVSVPWWPIIRLRYIGKQLP